MTSIFKLNNPAFCSLELITGIMHWRTQKILQKYLKDYIGKLIKNFLYDSI